MPLLELHDLKKSYRAPDGGRELVIDVPHFALEAEQQIALEGQSGSGKTTLLTLMGALRTPQSGSIRILGQELRGAKEKDLVRVRRESGYIFQSHNLLPALTVQQNVRVAMQLGELDSLPSKDKIKRIGQVLGRVGMADYIDKRIDQLSGGQRQRVAIARATIMKPSLLLADEPTGNLDSVSGRQVLELLDEMNAAGLTLLVVTHDPSVARRADRVLVLEDGRITRTLRGDEATNLADIFSEG